MEKLNRKFMSYFSLVGRVIKVAAQCSGDTANGVSKPVNSQM
jgi:hypothetical protein